VQLIVERKQVLCIKCPLFNNCPLGHSGHLNWNLQEIDGNTEKGSQNTPNSRSDEIKVYCSTGITRPTAGRGRGTRCSGTGENGAEGGVSSGDIVGSCAVSRTDEEESCSKKGEVSGFLSECGQVEVFPVRRNCTIFNCDGVSCLKVHCYRVSVGNGTVRRSRSNVWHDRCRSIAQEEEIAISDVLANVVDSKEVEELCLRPIWWAWCVGIDHGYEIWLPNDRGDIR